MSLHTQVWLDYAIREERKDVTIDRYFVEIDYLSTERAFFLSLKVIETRLTYCMMHSANNQWSLMMFIIFIEAYLALIHVCIEFVI